MAVNHIPTLIKGLKDLEILTKSQSAARSEETREIIELVVERFSHAYRKLIDSVMPIFYISFERDEDIKEAKKLLLDNKYGILFAEITFVRVSSSIIKDIKMDYIRGKRGTDKKDEVLRLLDNLDQLCVSISESLSEIERFVAKISGEIYDLLNEKKLQKATEKINEFRAIMENPLKDVRDEIDNLFKHAIDFIVVADGEFKVPFSDMKNNVKYPFDFEGSKYEVMKDEKGDLLLTEVG